jgi:hypothetical protein
MNDNDLKKIFTVHKIDMADEGFSEQITGLLPERRNRLPKLAMILFMLIGFVIMFVIQDITPLFEQIIHLATSINEFQMPSPGAVITYFSLLAATGIIGYSMVQVAEN